MTPPFDPVLLPLGPLAIHWYGLLIAVGILLGASVAGYLARRAGESPEHVWDMLVVAVLFAIVGARLYHVVSEPQGTPLGWSYYKENPLAILAIWRGGLGIYGAIVGGALGVLLYTRAHHLRPLRWLDFCAPGMAIGQAIGRWGNYMNRELYGPPTDLPWGLHIPTRYRIPPYTDLTRYPLDTRFHPTFLYESLAALGLCLLLLWLITHRARQLKAGDLLLGYLIGYSVIRFFTEFLRPDAWMLGGIAAAQVVALVLIGLGSLVLVIRHRPKSDKT